MTSRRLTGPDGTRYATESERLRDEREQRDRAHEDRRQTAVAESNTALAHARRADPGGANMMRELSANIGGVITSRAFTLSASDTPQDIVAKTMRGIDEIAVRERCSKTDATIRFMARYPAAYDQYRAATMLSAATPVATTAAAEATLREFTAAVERAARERGLSTVDAIAFVQHTQPELSAQRHTAITLAHI